MRAQVFLWPDGDGHVRFRSRRGFRCCRGFRGWCVDV